MFLYIQIRHICIICSPFQSILYDIIPQSLAMRQTRDFVPLPGDYGRGSSTLRTWIEEKMAEDESRKLGGGGGDDNKWPTKVLIEAAVLAGDSSLLEENVHILPSDSMVTMDYREDRVRIFVDGSGVVVSQPQHG